MSTDLERVQRVLVLDDRGAYSDLVRKYQVEIRTYLTRLTRQREIADELAQESFLLGYRRLSALEDGHKFRAWIYAIAHSQFLQWYGQRKKHSAEMPMENVSETSVSSRVEVESLLKSLRPEESSALILCLAHEFTHSEAAEILRMPVGTVKSLIRRARQSLGGLNEAE